MTLYIKTDGPVPDGCDYITAGKVYRAQEWSFSPEVFAIQGDDGKTVYVNASCQDANPFCLAFTLCDSTGTPVPAPWEGAAPEPATQCQCFNEPDWPSPEFAKQQLICDEFLPMDRDPGICERCEHNEACHVPQVDYRAHAEALADALYSTHVYCNCGHPYCSRCRDDRYVDSALAAFNQAKGV